MANREPLDERDLLEEIGVPRSVEAPSAFDLLGVPENCENDELVRKQGRERAKPLRKWEQYRANPAVQKMATSLKLRVSDAQKKLRTAESRAAYRKEFAQQRAAGFRDRIKSALTAGEEVTEERIRKLLPLAQKYGVDEATARKVISELAHHDNPFAALTLQRVAADDAWPTAFDILMVEESEKPPPDVVSRANAQMRKVDGGMRVGKISTEEASRLRMYVQEAVNTLSSPELTKAYCREIRGHRLTRYEGIVQLALSNPASADTAALIQLVHQGRQMRLGQEEVESVIAKVAGVNIAEAVGSAPCLNVSRSSIEAYVRGDGQGSQESLGIRNDGTGDLEVHVETSQSWIQITAPFFRTNSHRDLAVRFPPSRLRPGEKLSGSIHIRSNGGEAEVEVTALLGQLGSEATREDYEKAGRLYLMGLAFPFLLPFVILSWRFMMNRRESSFLAFHAMQSMFFGLVFLAAIVMVALMLPGQGEDVELVLAPCCAMSLMFGTWLGVPILLKTLLNGGRNIQVPGIANLIRMLL